MSTRSTSIDYDVPVDMEEMEDNFQQDEWARHEQVWLNYRHTRDDFFQDDDIIVATFPRSGTHICWYIAELLLHGADFQSGEYTFDDLSIIHCNSNVSAHPGPVRLFHTHMKPSDLGHKACLTGNRRVIHMVRNPKDTALSFYNLCFDMPTIFALPKSFTDWTINFCTDKPQGFGHTWVHHARSWEEFAKVPGAQVCCLTFEDFITDSRSVVEKISKFLKLDQSSEEIDRVTEKVRFSNMNTFKQSKFIAEIFAASESQHPSFFKKGKIGSWKDAFTVSLSEKFDAEIKKRMEGSKFYSLYC